MNENFTVNLDNFTQEEKENFLKLVEKGNKYCAKRWRGKKNDTFYYIAGNGCTVDTVESETDYDDNYYQFGNYFKTLDEAKIAREKQYVYQQLKDYAAEHNTKEINWDNYSLDKFCIAYDYQDNDLFIDVMQITKYPNTVYFTSEKIVKDAIKEIGEDKIKYYLFGIEN